MHMPTSAQGTGIALTPVVTLNNGDASTAIVGAPVYSSAPGQFSLAKADTQAHALVIGLAQTSVGSGSGGSIQFGDIFTATTGQWDAVAGTSGGLAFGTIYFLSAATAGRMTSTAPSTVGQQVTLIGIGVSTTQLRLLIVPPVGL